MYIALQKRLHFFLQFNFMKHFQLWGKIIVEVLVCHKKLRLSIQRHAYLLQNVRSFMVNSTSCKRPRFKWDMGWYIWYSNTAMFSHKDEPRWIWRFLWPYWPLWGQEQSESLSTDVPGVVKWRSRLGGRRRVAHTFLSIERHSWPAQSRASAAAPSEMLLMQSPCHKLCVLLVSHTCHLDNITENYPSAIQKLHDAICNSRFTVLKSNNFIV